MDLTSFIAFLVPKILNHRVFMKQAKSINLPSVVFPFFLTLFQNDVFRCYLQKKIAQLFGISYEALVAIIHELHFDINFYEEKLFSFNF